MATPEEQLGRQERLAAPIQVQLHASHSRTRLATLSEDLPRRGDDRSLKVWGNSALF